MNIVISIREVYGKRMAYPMCNRAHLLARLTGNKTFSRSTLYDIEELGYTVKVKMLGADELANWNGEL